MNLATLTCWGYYHILNIGLSQAADTTSLSITHREAIHGNDSTDEHFGFSKVTFGYL